MSGVPGMSKIEAVAELAKFGLRADARQLAALMVAIKALQRAAIHKHRNQKARRKRAWARKGGAE